VATSYRRLIFLASGTSCGKHLGVHYATESKMVKRAQQVKWQGKTPAFVNELAEKTFS
jgi:hypothetical protein